MSADRFKGTSSARRRRLVGIAVAALAWPPLIRSAEVQGGEGVAGHYYLESLREAGAELLLRKDGTFEWMMSYGADDRFASGTWSARDDVVVLTAAAPPGSPTFRLFREDELQIRKPPKEGTWVAIVGVPRVGPAPGMDVVFETRSGRKIEAVTDRNGDAIVDVAASESWLRAGLRKRGDATPLQWLSVPRERARARIAAFALDDAKWIIPQAFDRLVLKRRDAKLVSEDGRMVYAR